jgi:hypothetical protein
VVLRLAICGLLATGGWEKAAMGRIANVAATKAQPKVDRLLRVIRSGRMSSSAILIHNNNA